MLTFVARMKVKEGKEEEFINLAKALTNAVMANEPEVTIYQFYRLRDEKRGFAVIESFSDEMAEEAHRQSDHFKRLAPPLVECLDGTYIREFLDPLE